MGCLFGARLSPHADLTLIGHWQEQLAALRNARLRLLYPDGSEDLADVFATDDVSSVAPVDVAIIATKSVKTDEAAQGAALILKPDGLAITLQNGLGNLDILARHVGQGRATLGVTTLGAAVQSPGLIKSGGLGATHLATRPEIDGRVRELAAVFEQAELPVEVTGDVSSLVWGKLAVNCAINPLTALIRVPNGVLVEHHWTLETMREAAREVAAVAAAQGIALPFDDAPARAEEVARATAVNRSSMLQDVLRQVPTEIDTMCGAVSQIGARVGVATPANTLLYRLVKAIEETYAISLRR